VTSPGYGFNKAKKDARGRTHFYAKQLCLFEAKQEDATKLAEILVQNLRGDKWNIVSWTARVEPSEAHPKWSTLVIIVIAER